ncbi:MAG TPA: thiamine pyrophosphate-dependent enzyme [Spirochaetota bacterium]|nr:MAG: 2-oxoglutarate oxidoreductase subunit KorB [Spirochaetes bacterium ADurb.Bin133]HNZ26172.1 thiamine pyrophosphate-dependent enzyme [Spirochaetota bacterium]HOF01458.1 thiamine pyrophosphate-dependent enzyme [Spirochaetota bacterium]HOS33302.1 thiamine pyrophosphate-dependent enzyme [Spirochaetota bacterium]HOS55760.1 thiamine pyrophosphate-dependent enzyme [Spirochaetota bacterium]
MSDKKYLYKKTAVLTDKSSHYCPGCSHGLVHKMLAEIIEEFGIQKKTIFVAPVGCAVLLYDYIDCDTLEAAHGRAPASATGIKRSNPDNVVIAYQGDGDLLAIGMAETIHAANRGENITVIFINNAIYGMTGGQMAPTTLVGQKTLTTPLGRNPSNEGYPIGACELLNTLTAPYFIERCKVNSSKTAIYTKKVLKKAITNQMNNKGYSFVEILSNCNTNWGMTPLDANKWIDENVEKIFPVKNFRDGDAK